MITAAVLKLVPLPRSRQTAWLAVPSPAAACGVLRRLQSDSGERVVSAEYISRASLELVLEFVAGARDPLDAPWPHYLLLELAGENPSAVCATLSSPFSRTVRIPAKSWPARWPKAVNSVKRCGACARISPRRSDARAAR